MSEILNLQKPFRMSTATITDSAIDFGTTETQQMIADTIQKFGKEHIRPKMMEWDESQKFPLKYLKNWESLALWVCLYQPNTAGPV